jgi:ubiquinone/menaquinone biosynthesis C-methylase UbiE
MSQAVMQTASSVSLAFDSIAERYDELFTQSLIGRAQRRVVWNELARSFSPFDHVLELNCGTGEDALFLARRGVSVLACDASSAMIDVAQRRLESEAPQANLQFQVLSNESLNKLRPPVRFDGAFSNFSGLNCVEDISPIAQNLGKLVRSNGRLILCASSRFCVWETFWFLCHANARKAFRRISGHTVAHIDGMAIPVWYPTIRHLRRTFAPWFQLRSIRAVGLFVPPSYLESQVRGRSNVIAFLEKMDNLLAGLPLLRCVGDHVLLNFERVPS